MRGPGVPACTGSRLPVRMRHTVGCAGVPRERRHILPGTRNPRGRPSHRGGRRPGCVHGPVPPSWRHTRRPGRPRGVSADQRGERRALGPVQAPDRPRPRAGAARRRCAGRRGRAAEGGTPGGAAVAHPTAVRSFGLPGRWLRPDGVTECGDRDTRSRTAALRQPGRAFWSRAHGGRPRWLLAEALPGGSHRACHAVTDGAPVTAGGRRRTR